MRWSRNDPLLLRAARGDQEAARECLSRFGPIVWGLARRLSPTHADAEDAAQEIFLDIWRHGERYESARGSQEVFVAVVARRRLIDRRRRNATRPATEPLELSEPVVAPDDPERCVEAALAARAIGDLRPEQREVLRLSVAHGLTHEEIAAQTGMALGTVKSHARRGLHCVRKMLLGEPMAADANEDVE